MYKNEKLWWVYSVRHVLNKGHLAEGIFQEKSRGIKITVTVVLTMLTLFLCNWIHGYGSTSSLYSTFVIIIILIINVMNKIS